MDICNIKSYKQLPLGHFDEEKTYLICPVDAVYVIRYTPRAAVD